MSWKREEAATRIKYDDDDGTLPTLPPSPSPSPCLPVVTESLFFLVRQEQERAEHSELSNADLIITLHLN